MNTYCPIAVARNFINRETPSGRAAPAKRTKALSRAGDRRG